MSLTTPLSALCVGLSLVVLGSAGGCAQAEADSPPAEVGRQDLPIIDGEPAPDIDDVMIVFDLGESGLCSGTLVAERVVLTAKHCVQPPDATGPVDPAQLRVGRGPRLTEHSATDWFRAVDVVTTPGTYSDGPGIADLIGKDVALITLASSPGITPRRMKLTDPSDEEGKMALAVGYGQTPSGETGTKFRVDTSVVNVNDNSIEVDGTVCQGDSGGPLINPQSEVIGVVSVGMGEGCSGGASYYNRIDIVRDMILTAIERAGGCSDDGVEACDGFDNDCDGEIDEDCTQAGGACASDAECATGLCAETTQGKLCSLRCDPLAPATACPDGFVCAAGDSCEGVCEPGRSGELGFGAACERDEECSSRFCDDPGDGNRRCLSACRGGASSCLFGEACVAADGECGSCVDAALTRGRVGADEACADAADCRSGLCFDDGGARYCADVCGGDSDCDRHHHCRGGACVRGALAGLGGTCQEHADCIEGFFCAKDARGNFCTRVCDPQQAPCGSRYECGQVNNGFACLPQASVVGGPCEAASECLSERCFTPGSVCTRVCDSPTGCGPGLECVRVATGTGGLCLSAENAQLVPDDGTGVATTDDAPEDDGCSLGFARRAPGARLWVLLGLCALVLGRRLRRKG